MKIKRIKLTSKLGKLKTPLWISLSSIDLWDKKFSSTISQAGCWVELPKELFETIG